MVCISDVQMAVAHDTYSFGEERVFNKNKNLLKMNFGIQMLKMMEVLLHIQIIRSSLPLSIQVKQFYQ